MGKIRHVAFMIKDPPKVRDFYVEGLGFELCYESKTGSLMVLDGLFNLALLKPRDGESEVVATHRADGGEADQRPGINHFGFVVDSVDETLERLGSDLKQGETPQDGRPAEMRVYDPWGNGFDLSARGFFGREEVRLPAVRHVTIQTDHPDQVADFYKENLDLTEEGRAPDGSVYLGDGLIHLALVQEGLTNKRGIQYIGIQIEDWDETAERMKALGYPFQIPRDRDAAVAVKDPEGNILLFSQKGWGE
jgi:catechol 2,3-dioxygenase-like lactoylglutathione lyase family enzyme